MRWLLQASHLMTYILAGLDPEYNSVVSAVVTRVEPISVHELYGQLLSLESWQVLLQGGFSNAPSANATMHGCGGFDRGHSGSRGWYGERTGNNFGNNRAPNNNNTRNSNGKRSTCQVYEKEGHTAIQCWYHFDESYGPERKTATAVTHAYGIDTNRYTNTGATDHITGKLEKLDMRNKYNGVDQVHTASDSGMSIRHIGYSVIPTPSHDLVLKNILHVPDATKNLLSVHRFTTDNHASLEYFPNFFGQRHGHEENSS
jgi:hypothetical protein